MTPPTIVAQIAAETAQTRRGVVSATYTRTFHVHAGPMSRTDHLVFVGVYDNGTLVAVRILQDTQGRKAASTAQRAQDAAKYVHPAPNAVFHAPWDVRYLGEYAYRVVNPTTIAFTSSIKDTAHGSGTFMIDPHDDVVSYRYSMNANYRYVTHSNITGTRSEVLPGYWATVHEVQQYTGRYHLFGGGATTQITRSAFHRFANVGAAENAVDASGR